MDFSEALLEMKKGKCVARKGWNGKGMYVVKHDLYINENLKIDNSCLCLYNVKGQYNTWNPSITDIFAEDWEVVE